MDLCFCGFISGLLVGWFVVVWMFVDCLYYLFGEFLLFVCLRVLFCLCLLLISIVGFGCLRLFCCVVWLVIGWLRGWFVVV